MNVKGSFFSVMLLAISVSSAQVTSKGNGYSFASKYRAGQNLRYDMTMKSTGGTAYAGTLTTLIKVLSVSKTGDTTMQTTVNAPGRPPQVSKVVIDKLGRPVDNQYGTFTGNLGLPERPVKVGESWRGDANLGDAAGGADVKAKYTFRGLTQIAGQKVARISMTVDMRSVLGMQGTGDQFVRVSDGVLQKSVLNLTMSYPDPKTKKTVSSKIIMTVVLGK